MSKCKTVTASVVEHLRDLRLPTIRECFGELAATAQREALCYEQYLLELVRRESEERQRHPINRLLRQ